MNYNDVYTRMALLGDVLGLAPAAKAMSETLMMRAHYSRTVKEFETAMEQVRTDTTPADGSERTAEQEKLYNETVEAKAREDCGADDRRYSAAALEQICEAAMAKGAVKSALAVAVTKDAEGKEKTAPGAQIPAVAWLDLLAAHLAG